ncbi:uncharacterized protein LOC115220319 [Argonauta hians]
MIWPWNSRLGFERIYLLTPFLLFSYDIPLAFEINAEVNSSFSIQSLGKHISNINIPRKRKNSQFNRRYTKKILHQNEIKLNRCKIGVNCKLPDCWCFGGKPRFDKRDLPQLVYFTFNGVVDKLIRNKISRLFYPTRTNENGCRIRATIFIAGLGSDYREINRLYKAGHEIALNGLGKYINDSLLESHEVPVQKKLMEKYAGVPDLYITGWRNGRQSHMEGNQNKHLYNLKRHNIIHDSSLIIQPSNSSDYSLWPFTLDFGWGESCKDKSCRLKIKLLKGLWEIPSIFYSDFETSKSCYYIEDCFEKPQSSLETYDYLVRNFLKLHKSKTPFGIRLRRRWFSNDNKASFLGLDAFIRFIVDLENVYIITASDLIKWMQHPQPIFRRGNVKNFLGVGC